MLTRFFVASDRVVERFVGSLARLKWNGAVVLLALAAGVYSTADLVVYVLRH